uniref:Retrovirus-related Pol polyprotein from transposon TNT 1-94 n=1 Tax=Cajanus cajan TaxID=3821 RepID=A0A151TSC6_CAJCA|nr:Retrovirus-related Pol polyprotein from transposon TNT 1-94 [Cajanus cajan]
MEMARSMLKEKGLPNTFLDETVYTAVYLLNRCPTKVVQDKTPIEAWSGKKPSIKHLRIFRSICYIHVPDKKRHKLEDEVWVKDMKEEIKMIDKNNTWELLDFPHGKDIIGVKWVYKTKLNLDGTIQKHKARLVWNIYQLDVKFAFLNGVLEEKIYVEQPQGFISKGKEGKVLRLRKALYSLEQAPRAWYSKMTSIKDPVHHQRTKHITIKYHFIREAKTTYKKKCFL